MSTLQQQLQTAKLSDECKIDLFNHTQQVELQASSLPKRSLTEADSGLPSAVFATTAVRGTKQVSSQDVDKRHEEFFMEKSLKSSRLKSTAERNNAAVANEGTYFKSYTPTYHGGDGKQKNPFQESRSREKLSGKDMDFVHRYAEAMTRSKLPRKLEDDEATQASAEAYKEAFRKYTGREPTEKDLHEVDRLFFGFDEHGNVGVVQRPHACYPHYHVSSKSHKEVDCPAQVYCPQVPVVRHARDRYPGVIPLGSSTKNLRTFTASNIYKPAPHNVASHKRTYLDTVVGSK